MAGSKPWSFADAITGCQDATSAAPKVVLYYCNFSFPSRKCLIALYEKNVEFEAFHLNQTAGEQYQRWYLEMNPRGQVPVLKHGERVVTESARILEYIDLQFGTATQLFPSIPYSTRVKVEKLIRYTYFSIV